MTDSGPSPPRARRPRIPDELGEALEMAARVDGLSLNAAVCKAVDEYISKRRADPEFQRRLTQLLAAEKKTAGRLKPPRR